MSPSSSSAPERRHSTRVQYHEPITLQIVIESKSGNVFEVQGTPVTVEAINVSEGGIRIKADAVDSPGKILKLNIPVKKDETLDVFTRVAWTGNGACGLEFVAVDEQIRKWVKGFSDKK